MVDQNSFDRYPLVPVYVGVDVWVLVSVGPLKEDL